VLQQLTSAYFELLRMQARLRVADENVSEHARLEDLMGRRVAAEVSPAADLVLANVRLQQAITERIQLLRIRDTAKVALQQWSLSEVSTALPLRRIDMLPLGGGKQIDSEKIVSKVLAYSVQRRRLQHQLDAARAQRQLASAQGLPTVLAGYQYVWGGPAPNTADRGTAYLALQYQPGAGLAALSSLKAAARREDAVRQELAGIERELRAQVQTVLAEMDASNAQLVPSRNLLKGSSDIVESYLRQYQVGRRNWIEVLNAQRERAQAAYALADAEQGLQLAQVRLLIISGVVAPGELKAISG
jgi:adhesin transport system outer membrane protein